MRKLLVMAILMSLCMTLPTFAAGWEQRQDGAWIWRDTKGKQVSNEWKTGADGTYYYIGRNGTMEVSSLIEYKNDFYYVDELGRMVTNRWVKLYDADSEMERWYYFTDNGEAYRQKKDDTATLREINGKKYIFDDEGRMLFGWVNKDGTMADPEEPSAWREASYHCGAEEDGAVTFGWKRFSVDYSMDEDEENLKKKWFYFRESGRKITNSKNVKLSSPDGVEYIFSFNEDGVMTSQKREDYKEPEDQSRWIQKIPSKSQNSIDYDNETVRTFYIQENGDRVVDRIKQIDGKSYCFDKSGIMRTGLLAIKDKKYAYTLQNKNPEDDIWADPNDLRKARREGYTIMYFDESTGARKTGKVKLELLDGDYTLRFTTKGDAIHGPEDGYLYDSGVLMKAEEETEFFTVDGVSYEVDTRGRIQN